MQLLVVFGVLLMAGSISFAHHCPAFRTQSDVGKKVKGSKKRFVWEIIFKEDADQAQASKHTCVVELKHSVLAGRRTIAFNGEVIHDSAKVLNGKFEHGWAHKRHLLRITAKVSALSPGIALCHARRHRFVCHPLLAFRLTSSS